MNKKQIALFEIFLIVSSGFAFAHIYGEINGYFEGLDPTEESKFISNIREVVLGWLSKGLVSAQPSNDEGVWTCIDNVNGNLCQEFPSEECEALCGGDCFPGKREESSQCRLGTCFALTEGTCADGSPRVSCEDSGGQWSSTRTSKCNAGCCIIGSGSKFTTATTCVILSEREGLETQFLPEINTELACSLLSDIQSEGACVFLGDIGTANACRFLTKSECIQQAGQFHEGLLCSNPELNTVCERQDSFSCVEGKDEVYWLDSCGNTENIYDANKGRSYNNGQVLGKFESCNPDSPNFDSASCGNCSAFSL